MSDIGSVGRADVAGVLAQMRAIRAEMNAQVNADMRVADVASGAGQPQALREPGASFGNVLGDALSSVNALQQDSSAKAAAFARGESNNLVEVMVASQKSSVAFQAALQVRNRMVSAYQDIMNMPI
ncbi:MAG: flagellar hook-basal body complex protein FliE [Pseudomonadaceae bacterium]|nr:flagellar hook-basal body complex protein FliE [Pseudomonadaceae bacterium]